MANLANVVEIAAGESHSLALKQDGSLWAWGKNDFGQLGDGTGFNHQTPVRITGLAIHLTRDNKHTLLKVYWTW
ncbi:hypothetical protein CCP4SC76_5400003 [Gammaproteobacteria bacterium]